MWEALGGDPVPGDVDGVRQIAYRFRDIAHNTDTVIRRLDRLLAGSSGQIWTGPAADAFRARLTALLPDLRKLASSHGLADRAMLAHADRLDDHQGLARRAAADATDAWQDRERRRHDAQAAATETRRRQVAAAQALSQARQTRQQSVAAALTTVDPAEQLRLQQQAQSDETRRRQAESAAETARSQEASAVRAVDQAEAQLTAARRLGAQAAQLQTDANHDTVRRLSEAGAAGIRNRSALHRWWDDRVEDARQLTASPEFRNFLGALDAVSGILTAVAVVVAFVPGVGTAVAGVLLTVGTVLAVAVAVGTLLSFALGNARFSEAALSVAGVIPGVKQVRKGATLANRGMKLGGDIKRALHYHDARRATGFLRSAIKVTPKLAGKELTKLPVRILGPQRYFQVTTAMAVHKVVTAPVKLITEPLDLVEHLTHVDEQPAPENTWKHRLIDAVTGQTPDNAPDTAQTPDSAKAGR